MLRTLKQQFSYKLQVFNNVFKIIFMNLENHLKKSDTSIIPKQVQNQMFDNN